MKILGLDVGTKRIGIAKADTTTKIAVPNGYIEVNGQEFNEIASSANMYNTSIFVVGLPRSNNGNETKQSKYARNFAAKLVKTIPGAKVFFEDETLTSVEAEARLKNRKRKYEKGEIDAESAAIILQSFVERMAASAMSGTPIIPDLTAENVDSASSSVKKHSLGKTILIICIALFVLVLGAGVGAYFWYTSNLKAVAADVTCKYANANEAAASLEADTTEGCTFSKFNVKETETVDTIATNLKTAGLIRSDFAFKIYTKLSGKASELKSGSYDFRSAMSVEEIVDLLVKGAADENVFNLTILPGQTITDIKKTLKGYGYTESELEKALQKKYTSKVLEGLYDVDGNLQNGAQPAGVQLEGYLYGETYQFYKGEAPEKIFETTMNELYEIIVGNDLINKYKARGFSLREGIILASIIQKEAKSKDMPGVSMVFQNRLRTGMMLGSDVTATYAADLVDPERITLTDNGLVLDYDSLYNTRKHAGLPPGPISSPGVDALMAVANPDESHSHDVYFLTGDDGKMYYSDTAEGHEQNIRDYCKELCNVAL